MKGCKHSSKFNKYNKNENIEQGLKEQHRELQR